MPSKPFILLAYLAMGLAVLEATGEPAHAATEVSVDTGKSSELEVKSPFVYDARGRRDPFVPLVRHGRHVVAQPTASEPFRPDLYGVLWDPDGKSIALIDDGEYKVGDKIGNYRIETIKKDSVVLSGGGEPVVLKISFEQHKGIDKKDSPTGRRGP